jgi:hypothetical protein
LGDIISEENIMRYIHSFFVGLVLVASPALADDCADQNQASDATATPVTAVQTQATTNVSPWQGTSLVTMPAYADEGTASPASESENQHKSDYLDGGYYGGHVDH